MKSGSFLFGRSFLPAAVLISFTGSARAVTLTKENNATILTSAASWVENAAPSSVDVLLFGSTGVPTSGGLGVATGNGAYGGSLQVTNIAGNLLITQSAGNTWSMGSTTAYSGLGIDMSAATADVTIGATAGAATLRWGNTNYGGMTVASGRTLTINSNFSNQGNTKTIVMGGGGDIIFNGSAGSGGAMGFSITGGTKVTMNGTGAWSGGSSKEVINGTLNIGNDSALGSVTLNLGGTNASTPTITASGGARTISNNVTLLAVSVAGNATIAGSSALTINGTVTNSGANRTLSVNNSALTTFGTGGLALSEGTSNRTVTINGSGNLTISGAVTNGAGGATAASLTYSGAGVLSLANANTFGGTLSASSGTTRIDHTNAAQYATVSIGAANALAFGTGITSASFGGLSGSGDLALTNTAMNSVTLSVGNNDVSSTYSGALSGAGSITKIGNGILTLGGNSSAYTGGIALNNGTLSIGNSNGAGTGASTITAMNGTTIHANSGVGGNSVAAAIALSGTNANVMLTNANASGGFGSDISGSVDQTLTVSSAGGQTVNLNTSGKQLQNFYGTVSVASGQNLGFRSTSVNNGSDNALFEINGGLSTRNGGYMALGALSGSGTVGMGTSGSAGQDLTYTIGNRNSDADFSGEIKDGDTAGNKLVNVIKTGSGVQTFSGTSTYTGTTTVSSGTLLVNGALGNTAVDVTGGKLGGSGSIGGSVTLSGTAILSPGASVQSLVTGSVSMGTGTTYVYEATGNGSSGADLLAANGALGLDGVTLDLSGANLDLGTWLAGDKLTLISYNGGAITSGFTGYTDDSVYTFGANQWMFNYDDTAYGNNFATDASANGTSFVTLTVVPEPASVLLGALGLLTILRRRR